MTQRNLTQGEVALLKSVYGNSINYTEVTIGTRIWPGSDAVTIGSDISFPAALIIDLH